MEKTAESFCAPNQPEVIMKNMAGYDLPGGSTYLSCGYPEGILPKVENSAGHFRADGSNVPSYEQSERNLLKVDIMAGHDLTTPVCEQPEGILQLIDKLESIVDQLLPRYVKFFINKISNCQ